MHGPATPVLNYRWRQYLTENVPFSSRLSDECTSGQLCRGGMPAAPRGPRSVRRRALAAVRRCPVRGHCGARSFCFRPPFSGRRIGNDSCPDRTCRSVPRPGTPPSGFHGFGYSICNVATHFGRGLAWPRRHVVHGHVIDLGRLSRMPAASTTEAVAPRRCRPSPSTASRPPRSLCRYRPP